MLEVELIGQPGLGHQKRSNALEAEKLASSVSRKSSEIETWLLLNVNRKS